MRVDVITTLGEFEDVAQAAGGTGEESAENTVTESSAEQPLEVSPEILTETTQDIPDGPAYNSGLVTNFCPADCAGCCWYSDFCDPFEKEVKGRKDNAKEKTVFTYILVASPIDRLQSVGCLRSERAGKQCSSEE